ncbi:thioesterase II family protein [Pseudoalteromonas tunicata]|nr:thioesterase domain-containing protein [Pseudoalteromonas tunicata]ATC96713.1 hypothetical protein PTUN_b0299 [Pseudoalteromonas tunicata]AXT32879.1 thioesterase [Pseudoalteromonas tunicata]
MIYSSKSNKLFVIPKPRPYPKMRLFCFPFAGGGVSTYISWADSFPDDIELVIIQPPGRGSRLAEDPHDNMTSLIDELMRHADFITQQPYLLFGHSLGSRVAYELCYRLKQNEMPLPQYFIASGSRAPHVSKDKEMIHNLPKNEFIQALEKLNGTPKELLENRELMDLFMSLLRADFKIAETYLAQKCKMPFSILVLHGQDDIDIEEHQLSAWGELSDLGHHLVQLPGDHFFINQSRNEVIHQVSQRVGTALAASYSTL